MPGPCPARAAANASAAVYEVNGVEYVVYGFGGEPGQSFALGDAVIAFALPSAITAARSGGARRRGPSQITHSEEAGSWPWLVLVNGLRPAPPEGPWGRKGNAANKIDGYAESRRFFLSFVQIARENQIYLPSNECQPIRIQWEGCG